VSTQPRLREIPLETPSPHEVGGPYARYVLAVLVLVYVMNFLDRQILSILAEAIKADLGLSDAQIGFLYGTAFAVFYAVFGIPLGRLADVWTRRSVIALGLTVWSAMTAVSGLARGFGHLAAARIGVGIGEASATPAAFSMLSDYFPPERRATALAVYSGGIYIGAGIGIFIGGVTIDAWQAAFPAGDAPFGLRGWQVAFFIVGLPGLLLALWVRTLREPVRGQNEGLVTADAANPAREFFGELAAVLPPLTIVTLARRGAPRAVLAANVAAAAGLALTAWALIAWLGTPAQWIALAIGLYSAVSWGQSLRMRDPASFALIFQTPGLRYAGLGFAFLAFTGYGVGFWTPPFFQRMHGVSASQAGTVLGLTAAVTGFVGVALGGWWADRWRRTSPNGRVWVGLVTALAPLPLAVAMLTVSSTPLAYALNFALGIGVGLWIGPAASTVQDLVLPRMRAIASAGYLLVITFIGLALGPYTIGRLSVATGDLRTAMLLGLLANLVAAVFLLLASRHLPRDEQTRLDRARTAGERGV
jgi:MFS family permease